MAIDPFGELPDELRRLFTSGMFNAQNLPFGFAPGATDPVDWTMAKQVAVQVAGAVSPVSETVSAQYGQAYQVAEQWLDDTDLPAQTSYLPVSCVSAHGWIDAAITTLKPLIEPIAQATTDGLTELTKDAFDGFDAEMLTDEMAIPGLDSLPPEFAQMLKQFMTQDPSTFLAPAARALTGLQAGQVLGELSTRLLFQHEYILPTASHEQAVLLATNITDAFDGYGLDMRDVTVAIALQEAAHRRVFAAVPWLNGHIQQLFATFARGIRFDKDTLEQLSREFLADVDLNDEDGLAQAMERAAAFTVPPTTEQQHTIQQLHTVLGVVGAWARREAEQVAATRIPTFATIQEVLRRRLATASDGEAKLQSLIGLRLTPDDPSTADSFIRAVDASVGTSGLMQAFAHPENLPTFTELATPDMWLARINTPNVPDDLVGLFDGLGDAPVEPSADERLHGDT